MIYRCGKSRKKKERKKRRVVLFYFCLFWWRCGVVFLFDFCLFVDDDEKWKSFVGFLLCVFEGFFLDFCCVCLGSFLDFLFVRAPLFIEACLLFIEALIERFQKQLAAVSSSQKHSHVRVFLFLEVQECWQMRPLWVVEHSSNILLNYNCFIVSIKDSCFLLSWNIPCACVSHCKDAKNETFVSCKTFLRTFSELAFDLQASRTKPAVSSFHKTSHVRVFLLLDAQEWEKVDFVHAERSPERSGTSSLQK